MADIEDLSLGACSEPAVTIDVDTVQVSEIEDESEVAKNAMPYGFEDRFNEADAHNPYYRKAEQVGDDAFTDPNEIPIPRSLKDADPEKIHMLKEYVRHILAKLEERADELYDPKIPDPQKNNQKNQKLYEIARRSASKEYKTAFKKSEIYYGYRLICEDLEVSPDSAHIGMMQTKPFRSESGVIVFAVFTHPMWREAGTGKMKAFSCMYDCWYCPQQPGRPRSYVDGEPGNDRAVSVNYDTMKQVYIRGNTYRINGHPIDKAEVIILGGTFHSYHDDYHVKFFQNLYYSFNTINGERERPMLSLEEEMRLNTCMDEEMMRLYAPDHSICRVIGLTIETRPDQIKGNELIALRKYGVTRVQLGVQHIINRILLRVNRGCFNEDTIQAILNLKRCGFKVDIHLMPDLPKPFTEKFVADNRYRLKSDKLVITDEAIDWDFDMEKADRDMFEEIFHGENYCPDQVKIYPFEVMDWTRLKDEFERGLHVSYAPKDDDPNPERNALIRLLVDVLVDMPRWARVNRLKRDIPSSYNMGGLTDSHGRSFIHQVMAREGLKCGCIRCNEIKKQKIDIDSVRLEVIKYRASDGDEYFIYYTDDEDHVIGFIRLRLDPKAGYFTKFRRGTTDVLREQLIFPELQNCGMIRELHVYGEAVKVSSEKNNRTQQHAGFGTRLVYAAFLIAYAEGYHKMSVIPGEGVKQYYQNKFGFEEEGWYMTLLLRSDMFNNTRVSHILPEIVEVARDPKISEYLEKFPNDLNDRSDDDFSFGEGCVVS
jgi:histone acetyltransferase (RNA polymerase elongator complex component)